MKKEKIRELQLHDLDNGFFETLGHLSEVGNVSRAKAEKIFTELSGNPVYHIYVAELDGRIVGTATLLVEQKFFRRLGKVGHIENVATRKGFEGRGIAGRLVRHAIKKAKAVGCYKSILDCSEKIVPFYERHGFRRHETGMRLDF
jgi:glucosamine-phosphate N-acetyltransferase